MESFYGGPKGRDFDIKEIFTSKYQMDRDLSKGWTSSIFPGDLVVVSYGLPSDTNYDIYRIMGKAITLLFGKNVIMIKMEADLRAAYTIR